MSQYGQNVDIEVTKDGKLIITVDLTKTFGISGSGKSTIIASTQGNQSVVVPGRENVQVGLNVYTRNR